MQESRAAVVTGASSGIGQATARRLAQDGDRILAVGRNAAALKVVCDEITAKGGVAVPCVADVTADDAPARIVAAALKHFGRIDVLVNAAGIIASGSVADTTDEAWDVMMNINVRAPFRLIRAASAELIRAKGAVVNLSSVTGTRAFPGIAAYCVSKSAVDQLTRCAALEMAAAGVRVNAVNPGVVVTNLHRRGGMDETKYAAFLEHSKETHPMGRPGTPDDVASLIRFLVSAESGWITGITANVDGGRHLTCLR
ncbi:MAG: SDR family oxidoreductase [Acidobacteria bacterium]|nr:MAG: SDR family oxidoreductase [Acidobacteriota bacterium]